VLIYKWIGAVPSSCSRSMLPSRLHSSHAPSLGSTRVPLAFCFVLTADARHFVCLFASLSRDWQPVSEITRLGQQVAISPSTLSRGRHEDCTFRHLAQRVDRCKNRLSKVYPLPTRQENVKEISRLHSNPIMKSALYASCLYSKKAEMSATVSGRMHHIG
jgi:hypothetical protein